MSISRSHIDYLYFPKLLENKRKDEYKKVIEKVDEWLKIEENAIFFEFILEFKMRINRSIGI